MISIPAHLVHVYVPVHSVHEGESMAAEVWTKVQGVISSIPITLLIFVALGAVALFTLWILVGKGFNSHAGREEVRRSYRRQLAREMAKQDAEEIREGHKRRKWWYIW